MKKLLALLLAFSIVLALCACGGGDTASPSPSAPAVSTEPSTEPSTAPAESPDAPPSETVNNDFTGEIGFFDPDFDYTANPKYRVKYFTLVTSVIYEMFDEAFSHWAELLNIEYAGRTDTGGDKDAFLSNLTTFSETYDGLLLDADETQYNRVAEIMAESNASWVPVMGIPRDYSSDDMHLLNIYVGFDMYEQGLEMASELLRLKDELWPDVDASEFGMISVDFSVSPPLHQRALGAIEGMAKADASWADRSWFADLSIGNMDVDTTNTVVSSVIAQHPEYEYWLCFGLVDDCAPGANAAFDNTGHTERAAVVSIGGVGAQTQWDAGMYDSWRASYLLPDAIFAEPIICSLYAFMNGDSTPETIWPEWVNANDPGYAQRLLPSFWITPENYKQVFAWADVYSGSNMYPQYSKEGITRDTFTTKMPVPDYYKLAS